MKYYFLDTSALVHAYAPGSDPIRRLVIGSARGVDDLRVVVCDYSLPEAVSALIERRQAGELEVGKLSLAVSRLEADFNVDTPAFVVVEVSGVMGYSVDLMRIHELTSEAAVILAAAIGARASMPAGWDICLVSEDEDQIEAAEREGFEVCRPHDLPF